MSSLDAILNQYEKNQTTNTQKKFVSNEDRLKKYFAAFLPKGQKEGEKIVRILPTKDGSSPFKEVWFHEVQIQGRWQKLYDPGKNSDGSPTGDKSPLNDVEEALKLTGNEQDKILARQYRSRKFYIVKVVDRSNEDDGVKFWRFKHNYKGDGIMDKLVPLFQKRGDITDTKEGRDISLILKQVKSPNGVTYTSVSTIMTEDPSPINTDESLTNEWLGNDEGWRDVYSQKPVEYLEAISKGETPEWDSELKKYVYTGSEQTEMNTTTNTTEKEFTDPQSKSPQDEDLPF
tara:strand:+ start:1233 stop:2096 length:864 start_codon:yes stop_codon:yes gene_type:complete